MPIARAIVAAAPDRVLWGTDWPHPNVPNDMPDDGELVDLFARIVDDPALQRHILVDNPTRLYWGKADHRGQLRIGLVGYGEVGKILGRALVERQVAWVGTWDRLLGEPAQAPAMRAHATGAGVEPMGSLAALLEQADVVISAVTASQAHAVAVEAARAIRPGTWFVDLNSASPGTKADSGRLIDGAGGRFVEVGRDDLGAAVRHQGADASWRRARDGASGRCLRRSVSAWKWSPIAWASPPRSRCAAAS